jgi:hypothetical protein
MKAIDVILNAMQVAFPTFARSDGSIEAKLIDVVGTYADSEAIERQNTLNVINTALANQRITRKEYYRRKSVAFQQGDALIYDSVNQGAYYEVIDESKQIVKQSYIVGSFPLFTNLVNAIDGATGHLRKLTTTELDSFIAYFEAFQPIGMDITVQSLDAAKISDDNMKIYVQAGADLQAVLDEIKANLLAHETTLRPVNTVTLSEIENIMQLSPSVVAVGWSNPTAFETLISGDTRTTSPILGVFSLESGVFIFDTDLQLSNLQTIE